MTALTTRPWPRVAVALIGLVYLVLGIAGFFTLGTAHVGHDTARTVWLFSSSPVLNIAHTVLGLLGLLATRKAAGATAYSWFLFVAFTGLTAYGILATSFGTVREDPVNLNWADNVLHGVTALVALAIAISGTRSSR